MDEKPEANPTIYNHKIRNLFEREAAPGDRGVLAYSMLTALAATIIAPLGTMLMGGTGLALIRLLAMQPGYGITEADYGWWLALMNSAQIMLDFTVRGWIFMGLIVVAVALVWAAMRARPAARKYLSFPVAGCSPAEVARSLLAYSLGMLFLTGAMCADMFLAAPWLLRQMVQSGSYNVWPFVMAVAIIVEAAVVGACFYTAFKGCVLAIMGMLDRIVVAEKRTRPPPEPEDEEPKKEYG